MFDELIKAAVMGVVEGVTEFLPISSTGHLIVVGEWIGFENAMGTETTLASARASAQTFEIFIQLGAILSVVWMYRKKIFCVRDGSTDSKFLTGIMRFWMKIFVSFLPAAIVGLVAHSYIKTYLFTPSVIAISLIVGGIVIFGVEHFLEKKSRSSESTDNIPPEKELERVSYAQALWIGIAQVFALIPGVSRSGATIIGALLQKLDRKTATEYSFFLAIPTMLAATGYDLLKSSGEITASDVPIFAVGFIVAFFSALIAIKTFLKFIATHSFRGFAWYRIGAGVAILLLASP